MEFVACTEPSTPSSYRECMRVAIVGGGLSGLATALALQKIGIKCTVFEKDLCFSDRMQGYGLTLTNNPKGPLNALGLLDECNERDCPSNAHWVCSLTFAYLYDCIYICTMCSLEIYSCVLK